MYMCMQVHDNANKISTIYTQAVSPTCNHPNGDGWFVSSTGQRDAEGVQLKAALLVIR